MQLVGLVADSGGEGKRSYDQDIGLHKSGHEWDNLASLPPEASVSNPVQYQWAAKKTEQVVSRLLITNIESLGTRCAFFLGMLPTVKD